MRYQQEMGQKLVDTQRRKMERREDLLRVAGAMGIPRAKLSNPDRWQEVARPELSYEPDRALVEMLRDVARTTKRLGTLAQQQSVRRAITLYIARTLLNECLEPLGQEDYSGRVLELYQGATKEYSEEQCAVAVALQAPNPNNDETAAREAEEAGLAAETLAVSLRERARRFVAKSFDTTMREWR